MAIDKRQQALDAHISWAGKIEVVSRASITDAAELSVAYTPGVAEPCLEIAKDIDLSYDYTRRWNLVAVVTDGSAVLGLGDIGPEAGMPVMEGKCALFKTFGGVDAFPLCIRSHDVDEIVRTVELLQGSFGGVNLEDISAPRCFEIERRLKEVCDIPIFHDDQHGTAVVCTAALRNACKLTGRAVEGVRVVISGAGAAGTSIARLMKRMGIDDIVVCDRTGAIYAGRSGMNAAKEDLASWTNPRKVAGTLADALVGADVFVGVSAPGLVTREMVASMAADPIVFAMANPVPEITPDEAYAGGAAVVATGRSDYPNQVNNVLAFPGIFRGALDVRARDINEEMLVAAAGAIADAVGERLASDCIIPGPFEEGIAYRVADAVAEAARASGVARMK